MTYPEMCRLIAAMIKVKTITIKSRETGETLYEYPEGA